MESKKIESGIEFLHKVQSHVQTLVNRLEEYTQETLEECTYHEKLVVSFEELREYSVSCDLMSLVDQLRRETQSLGKYAGLLYLFTHAKFDFYQNTMYIPGSCFSISWIFDKYSKDLIKTLREVLRCRIVISYSNTETLQYPAIIAVSDWCEFTYVATNDEFDKISGFSASKSELKSDKDYQWILDLTEKDLYERY